MSSNNILYLIIRTARSSQIGLPAQCLSRLSRALLLPFVMNLHIVTVVRQSKFISLLERQGASRCRRRVKCYSVLSLITIHIICRCYLFWITKLKVCIIYNKFFSQRHLTVKTEGCFRVIWAFLSVIVHLPEANLHILWCIASLLTVRMKGCSDKAYILYNSAHYKKETLHNESITSVSEASL